MLSSLMKPRMFVWSLFSLPCFCTHLVGFQDFNGINEHQRRRVRGEKCTEPITIKLFVGMYPFVGKWGGSSSASPAHYTADHTYDTTPWSDSDHGSLSLTLAKISTREECLLGHTCFGHVMSTYPLYSQKTCYREIIQHSEPSWVY